MKASRIQNRGVRAGFAGSLAALILASLAVVSVSPAYAKDEDSDLGNIVIPDLLKVPVGQELAAHFLGVGVQIYTCTVSPTDPTQFVWTFKAPEAVLLNDDGKVVGMHYAGPTWESKNGSKVVGKVLQRSPSPLPATIPWLLLQAASNSGHGIFAKVTYIQRLNTMGGAAPSTGADAAHLGQEIRVPYTADYLFYRASDEGDNAQE